MPYNGGLLGRWQNPYQQRDPFQQLPQAPPPMPAPVMNGGFGPNPTHPIGMAPMPRPTPARAPGPAMPQPLPNPGMFQPTPPPMPETPFQMAPIDPSGAPYRQQVSNQLEMPNDPALAAYDPATAAYPTQVQRQPQPGDQATNAQGQQGDGKFFGMSGMDWITMGMALMGGAQNGGDWSMPLQAFQGIQRGNKEEERYQQEMKRQAAQDKMQEEIHRAQLDEFGYAKTEREGKQRVRESRMSLAGEMLKELPPDASPMIRTLLTMGTQDPEAFDHVINYQMEQLRNKREDELTEDDRAFQKELARIKQLGDERLANRQFEKSLAAAEAGQFSGLSGNITGAMDAVANIEKALGILDSRAGRGDDGTDLFAGDVAISKIFRGAESTADLQLFDALANQRGIKVLGQLKGAPSDKDFEAVLSSIGTGEISINAARSLLQDQLYQAKRDIAQAEFMRQWRPRYGTVSMGRNEAGQSFDQAFADHWAKMGYKNPNIATEPQVGASWITAGSLPRTPQEAAAVGLKVGGTIELENGQSYRWDGKQMIPIGKSWTGSNRSAQGAGPMGLGNRGS